jgi:alcohol dehydrogenase (cytochrome c)
MLSARVVARLLLPAMLVGAPAIAQPRPDSPAAFSADWLSDPPATSWPTNGGNLFNQRYSPLTQIEPANVERLGAVWRTHLLGSGVDAQYSGSAQPLVDDGTIYIITGANDVFALSIASGEIVWNYSAELDPGLTSVCCGWTSRGVALSEDRVFVGRLDGRLVALDRADGTVVWDIQAEPW